MRSERTLRPVQLISDLVFGDAAANEALTLDHMFERWGLRPALHAARTDAHYAAVAQPLAAYRPERGDLVLLHYTAWSPAAEAALAGGWPLVLVYHNVTPPAYLEGLDPGTLAATAAGRARLRELPQQTVLALAKSAFSRGDLLAAGFGAAEVLPYAVDYGRLAVAPDPTVLARWQDGAANLLVVGRVVPHKRVEDAIKLLAHYRVYEPSARLLVVGAHDELGPYCRWLRGLALRLGVADGVHFLGQVPQPALVAYYRVAAALLCLSEHEGFGVPLVEAMHLGVPVLAHAAAALPETLGDAGVLVLRKHFPTLAALLALVARPGPLRDRLVACGRERAAAFAAERLEARWREVWERASRTRP
ncbi:MAG: glycosyltransferase [Chloroflexi bacterium]|nr:glycosyltransferase [Chloroflexota bacterium]